VQQLEKIIEPDHKFAKVAACVWAWESPARPSMDRLLEKYEQQHLTSGLPLLGAPVPEAYDRH
jgi:hypothetical protein